MHFHCIFTHLLPARSLCLLASLFTLCLLCLPCGCAIAVLASTFLLYSVGLGAGAVPTAGALNWVLKDGLGQMGTLLFGKTIAHNFDVSPRRWYLMASAKLNLAMG